MSVWYSPRLDTLAIVSKVSGAVYQLEEAHCHKFGGGWHRYLIIMTADYYGWEYIGEL